MSALMEEQSIPRDRALVSQDVFTAITWTLVALCTTLVVSRLVIRFKTMGRLSWDDAFVVLSWAMLLSTATLWKYNLRLVYEFYARIHAQQPFDVQALKDWEHFETLVVPLNVLFYSGLWAIKLSFLLFFRKLGNQIRSFEIWWWFVATITGIGYIVCIADIQWECTVPAKPITHILQYCGTFSRIRWVNRTFYANCALDVITDSLILSIPFAILWNTRIPLPKKLVLFGVFGATIAIMAVAIIRVAVVSSSKQNSEIAWLYFWTYVEHATAILIACVASFRQLFVASQESLPGSLNDKTESGKGRRKFFGYSKESSNFSVPGIKWNSVRSKKQPSIEGAQSQDHILPLQFVTVHKSYDALREVPKSSQGQ